MTRRPYSASSALTDAAYRLVKREIVECALPPGIEVSERELMERWMGYWRRHG